MDIWDWVFRLENDLEEAGHEHASKLIEQLTTEILEMNIGKAEALIPEAIALSRSLKNPWLEVFFRHWEMRNRIGNKSEGESVLAEVVSLFEFAHRDETITCPQTVCVTQDLSACYANIDGPAWVEERKAVCNETFERIDPSWSCFHCLSCEYADALLDEGKPEEALDYLKAQGEKITTFGEEVSEAIRTFEVHALLRLNQPEKALAILEKCEADVDGYDWPVSKQDRHILKAHTLALLGKVDESWEILPAWNDVAPRYYLSWVRAVNALLNKEPEKNTWSLGSAIQAVLTHFVEVGAHRRCIEVAEVQIKLALARGSVWTAKKALVIAYETLPKLRAPLGADKLLAALSTEVEHHSAQASLPVPAEALLAWLNDQASQNEEAGRNPEQELELLILAVEERPNDEQLIDITVSALQACSATKEAEALLWRYIENNHEQESDLAYQLLGLLVRGNKLAELERLANYYTDTQPTIALWCRIQQAYHQSNYAEAKQRCLKMYEIVPSYLGAPRVLVAIAVQEDNFAEAEKWQQIIVDKITDDSTSDVWDLLTYSCANQNWVLARSIAKQLEITLESTEGVINEDWGWIRVEVVEENEKIEYLARCTGPVTAVIKEPAHPSKQQRVDDKVVFDAAQLAPVPEDEEERKNFIPLYRMVKTLKQGDFGRTWFVDGVYPGEEMFKAFEDIIDAKGWRIWVNSNQNYQVTDQFDLDETPLPAIFFSITAPKSVSSAEIHRLLEEVTADWVHPVHWLRLAEEVGVSIDEHQEIITRYGL